MKKRAQNSSAAGKRKPERARNTETAGSLSRQAEYVLRLYVSGSTAKSAMAVDNIKRVCEQYLKSRYKLEVIDIYQQANVATDEQVLAVPTLIRQLPLPLRRLIGDLSDEEKILVGLNLKKRDS